MSGEQKLKEGDIITQTVDTTGDVELIFFTDHQQAYKTKAYEMPDGKASMLGEYIPSKLGMDEGEQALSMVVTKDYKGFLIFVFDNGRISKVDLQSYYTKQNRKKLINAYTDKHKLLKILHFTEEGELLLTSSNRRMLLVSTAALQTKSTKANGGVAVMTQKKGQRVVDAVIFNGEGLEKPHRYRTKSLPAAGSIKQADDNEQISLL